MATSYKGLIKNEKSIKKKIKYCFQYFIFELKRKIRNKDFSFWMLTINGSIIIFVFLVPVLLRFNFIKKFVSYYLTAFPNLDYKVLYMTALGSLLGTIITITSALAIQNIFSKRGLEKEKIQKEKQGLRLVHRVITTELFSNGNVISEIFGKSKSVTLSASEVVQIKEKISLEKFHMFYKKIFELHTELVLDLMDIYSLFEKISQANGCIYISEKEHENYLIAWNKFQSKYNHL